LSINLESEIANWDGHCATDIEEIFDRYLSGADFINHLITLLDDELLQNGASWLLKHYFETSGVIDKNQAELILSKLYQLNTWQAQLHILQSLAYIPIAVDKKEHVEYFLRNSLSSKNRYVRAWAYDGFYLLSTQFSEYAVEVEQFFEMAMKDEAPSVKARIRNIIKKGNR